MLSRDVEDIIRNLRLSPVNIKIICLNKSERYKELGFTIEEKQELAKVYAELVSRTADIGRQPDTTSLLMESLIKTILKVSDDVHFAEKLKEHNLVAEWLANWIYPTMNECVSNEIFKIIIKLTKGSTAPFKPLFVTKLIRLSFSSLMATQVHGEKFLISLKLLITICNTSPNCYLIARADGQFKQVWKKLTRFVMETQSNPKTADYRIPLLLFHLMYILEAGPNPQILLWGMQHGMSYAEQCFELCIDRSSEVNDAFNNDILDDLREFFSTLLAQVRLQAKACEVRDGVTPSDLGIPADFIKKTRELENKAKELIQSVLLLMKTKLEEKAYFSYQMAGLIKLVNVLTPDFIPLIGIQDGCKRGVEVVTGIARCDKKELKDPQGLVRALILESFIHLITIMLDQREQNQHVISNQMEDQWRGIMLEALNYTVLYSPESPFMERVNMASCRLISLIRRSNMIQIKLMNQHTVMKFPVIKLVLDHCLTTYLPEFGPINEEKIGALVELLGLLSDNSSEIKGAIELLMEYIRKPEVAAQIAAAICCGDGRIIFRALTVTGSVSFSQGSLAIVAYALANIKNSSSLMSNHQFMGGVASPLAIRGIVKLEERLEDMANALTESIPDDKMDIDQPPLLHDIMSLYELKGQMHETEKQNLRDQIYEQSRYTEKLKSLVNKQSMILAQRLASQEMKDRQIMILTHKYANASGELSESKTLVIKELEKTKEMLSYKSGRLDECEKELQVSILKVKQLTKEVQEFKSKAEKNEAAHKIARDKVNMLVEEKIQRDEELEELRLKLAAIEKDLRTKDEERRNLEQLMEMEKTRTDLIRGLLGKNLQIT